jgi:heme-degrading monooxygenase HmoA
VIARIGSFDGGQHATAAGVETVEQRIMPILRGAAGFVTAYWLVDRKGDRSLSVSLWEDAEAASSAEQRLRDTPLAEGHVRLVPTTVETFEVVTSI